MQETSGDQEPNEASPFLNKESEWIEMDGKPAVTDSKQSRFQVAKVDFASDTQGHHPHAMAPTEGAVHPSCEAPDSENAAGSQESSAGTHHSGHSSIYDTHNIRSLRHYTREALPRVDNYRNIMSVHAHMDRPTLDELHNPTLIGISNDYKSSEKHRKQSGDLASAKVAVKLGWIQGVLIRCLLNIWGVMLFLRLSWVVGQGGIGLGCLVVLLASLVTTLTTLSMSAICTNGEVKGGGTYYMISRSLGPEFGGAIGLIFALANAVAVAMYVVGFAETVVDLLKTHDTSIFDGGMNDIRIIGGITVFVLLGIAIIGTQWESKAQVILLIILLIAMLDFIVGSFFSPTLEQQAKGFVGYDVNLALENLFPAFRNGESFFSIFSVYFPAATGILAGANISGDLSDPQRAIPKGTFLAILITTISYVIFAIIAGFTVLRDANGQADLLINGTIEDIRNCSLSKTGECMHGLMNFYQVMELVSAFGPLIYAGIFAATLSSALASLVSAPKVFQALCKDKLFPHIHMFAKGYGINNEPRRGYILAFAIALACIAIGELNAIAPIISNFFLAAYCLINFSCFHGSFARSPGFRPAFKYYNMWLSLCGAILCLVVMFIMNWWTALLTFAIVLALYIYIYYRKPDVNWGSSTQAQTYKTALNSVIRLNQVQDHVKNYRPQILVLSGNPSSRPPLIDFTYSITKKLSLMVCGHVTKCSQSQRSNTALKNQAYQWLHKRRVKAFFALVNEESFSRGVRSLIQLVGIGKLQPNVVFMGYKSDWQQCDPQELLEYFAVVHNAFDMHMALGILRLQEGLDYSQYVDIEEAACAINGKGTSMVSLAIEKDPSAELTGFRRNVSSAQLSQGGSSRETTPPSTPALLRTTVERENKKALQSTQLLKGLSKDIPKEVLISVNQFQRKQKKGTIDVWWLYDDGGLTLLIPYLLTTRSQWSNCKLRVFSLANKKDELDQEQRNMAALLSKFRIDYSDVTVVPDIVKPPQESSKRDFENLISQWRTSSSSGESESLVISESELLALKEKTNRHIRLRELLLQYSRDATLIVMTLPVPRKGTCSAPLYMAWLETLTRNMPPFLLLRGNQTSVLTFYS